MLPFLAPAVGLLKDVKVWIILGLLVVAGFLFVRVQWLKADLAELGQDIERQKTAIVTLHTEKRQCLDAKTIQDKTITNLEDVILGLQTQLEKERKSISFWKKQHDEKAKLLKETTEVPAEEYIKEEKVVDENSSNKFVNHINKYFDRMRKQK